ncbi:MAG: hypothetical protein LBR14_00250 [Clostridiales Family XIII bacterium]|jgi:hypothetical protein|nr:hypothetical protein [Clostridiales Family XIII bacterium]
MHKLLFRKKVKRGCHALLLSVVVLLSFVTPAYAYFNLPGVAISVSQGSVTMTSGQSASISVSVSPASEAQLPGCGMPECPQSCDEFGAEIGITCQDPNGWCTCGGSTYQTFTTQVSAVSQNSSIAQASYSGGVLSITGVSPGTTTITINAMLEKHVPSSTSISVTVTAPAGPSSGDTGSSSGSGTSATPVTPTQSAKTEVTNTATDTTQKTEKKSVTADAGEETSSGSIQNSQTASAIESTEEAITSDGSLAVPLSAGNTDSGKGTGALVPVITILAIVVAALAAAVLRLARKKK